MSMKRFLALIAAIVLSTAGLWAGDDTEVIVTRQLTSGQRNALPEKTVMTEMKRLSPNKKAEAGLIDAIIQVLDTIAGEDYQNRTFVLLLEEQASGEIAITVNSDDILTRAKGHDAASIYYGDLEHARYHFVVLSNKDNMALLEKTFKRQGKVKFIQEFEFVDYKTSNYPTNVIGWWSSDKGLLWRRVAINENHED